MENYPIAENVSQSGFKFLPNPNQTPQKIFMTFEILPNCQNLVKSGHTDRQFCSRKNI